MNARLSMVTVMATRTANFSVSIGGQPSSQ